MTTYSVFNDEGYPSGFYADDIHGPRTYPIYDVEGNVTGEEPNPDCLIPVDAVEITEDQWNDMLANPGARKWDGNKIVAYDPPPSPPIIPDRVTRRQFRLQLINAGLLDQVEDWVATQDVRTRAAYADSTTFVRSDEMLVLGFDALGFTVEQVDAFFMSASAL